MGGSDRKSVVCGLDNHGARSTALAGSHVGQYADAVYPPYLHGMKKIDEGLEMICIEYPACPKCGTVARPADLKYTENGVECYRCSECLARFIVETA